MTDTNNFILTTDADVQFTPESVEALLDLMLRDTSVGAVCARTYPLGSGPVVWYLLRCWTLVPKGLFEYDLHNVNVIFKKPFNRSNCYIKKMYVLT